jgi:exodeoxyribonuclease VII large subunit
MSVLKRRAPHVKVVLRPALVQGENAAPDIVRAIEQMNAHTDADVLIVGRGGGSIEDLWCFNEEMVARTIASSRIPVVSAVGHEIDFTLADFAADLRAPTPSAGAEVVVRDTSELRMALNAHTARLRRAMIGKVDELAARVESVKKMLTPERFIMGLSFRAQAVDEMALRLKNALTLQVSSHENRLERLKSSLAAMNPRSVLERGYSIVYRDADSKVVTEAGMVNVGDDLSVELSSGSLRAEVSETKGSRP